MTLGKLIEAVEAGTATRTQIEELAAQAFGLSDLCIDIGSAYARKDINAARAVHDALLPGWWAMLRHSTRPMATVGYVDEVISGHDEILSRAWLLAILTAKQAEGRG